MSNRVLGIFAPIGSPWLFIGMYLEQRNPRLLDSWFTGVWGLIFISGWICSVIALRRLKATGNSSFGKILLIVLLIILSLANVSNVIQVIVEKDKPPYFMVLDMCWPLSNVIMLITGIMVIIAKGLPGWRRWIPLATGLWFPLAMLSFPIDNKIVSLLVGFYSVIAWALLAIVIITTKQETEPVAQTNY